jgi:hypothetical protein
MQQLQNDSRTMVLSRCMRTSALYFTQLLRSEHELIGKVGHSFRVALHTVNHLSTTSLFESTSGLTNPHAIPFDIHTRHIEPTTASFAQQPFQQLTRRPSGDPGAAGKQVTGKEVD